MYSLEALQRPQRRVRLSVNRNVDFDNLIASKLSCVLHRCRDNFTVASRHRWRGHLQCGVGKGGVAQSMTEGKLWLIVEVTIGPSLHAVVVKRWELCCGCIER